MIMGQKTLHPLHPSFFEQTFFSLRRPRWCLWSKLCINSSYFARRLDGFNCMEVVMVRYVPPPCDRAYDWLRITGVGRVGVREIKMASRYPSSSLPTPHSAVRSPTHSWGFEPRQFDGIITTGGFYPATSATFNYPNIHQSQHFVFLIFIYFLQKIESDTLTHSE